MKRSLIFFLSVSVTFLMAGCGGEEESETGLSEFELEHGIGPVTERVEIGDLDMEMAEEGQVIFGASCAACHQMDSSLSGPALRRVTNERTPEFIMNYILNPTEMRERHPVGQELDERFNVMMTNMGVSQEDARKIVEYLRAAAEGEI
jgi:cytochrome c